MNVIQMFRDIILSDDLRHSSLRPCCMVEHSASLTSVPVCHESGFTYVSLLLVFTECNRFKKCVPNIFLWLAGTYCL
jgi:hypothetical protein